MTATTSPGRGRKCRPSLTEEESAVAGLHYDINEVGEMHHNPEKNVLYVRASVEEIAMRLSMTAEARGRTCSIRPKQKMYAARLQRPTPYVDKTVYVGWNCAVRFRLSGSREGA